LGRVQIGFANAAADLHGLHGQIGSSGDAIWARLIGAGKRRGRYRRLVAHVGAGKGRDSGAGVEVEVDGRLPAADYLIERSADGVAEGASAAEGKIVDGVAVEEAGNVGGAAAIVAHGVVFVLEEVLRCLGLRFACAFFVAVGTEVADGVGHALGPGVGELHVETVEAFLV